ncbi:hypothetical protein D9758_017795 [Tetrapyrgos nigripes]|uniref:DUF6535 domain-containing protein n=1 Tax=Tetrapyrgos nigripes TaxID=182062 RepID=A0A8H5B949_9AGAR|nr:hypothetical protein D9758_017795 [Tetrapyrgos nigripes]
MVFLPIIPLLALPDPFFAFADPFFAPPLSSPGPDNDKKPSQKRFQLTADEQACGKMWSVYIREAERYDKSLVEGWKGDMEGMVIFSALYSASLTAFLIESYKTLQPDPAQDTVLSPIQNSNNYPTRPFRRLNHPVLKLLCRPSYIRAAVDPRFSSIRQILRPSPIRQARVFAYIYFGLRDFGMHSFVDIIPFLLHLSLFLFFGGLVAFLSPVNHIITYIMIGVLGVFLLIYTALTVIPLVWLNAPYGTPLSGALWQLGNAFGSFLARKHDLDHCQDATLSEALLEKSLQGTSERDGQALVFTMQSLTDDDELLPMIEAIQDVLYNDNQYGFYIREANVDLIMPLIMSDDPEVNIISRITQYLKRSQVVPALKDPLKDSSKDSPLHGQGSMPPVYSLVYTLMYMLATPRQATDKSQMLNKKHVQTHLAFTEDLLLHIAEVSGHHKSLSSTVALLRFKWMSCIRDVVALISRNLDDMKRANGQNIPASALRAQISHLNKIWESLDESRMNKGILNSYTPLHTFIDYHKLPRTLKVAGEALKKWGMSVECSAAVPEELEAALDKLKLDDTWAVTRSTILFEYLWQVLTWEQSNQTSISELPPDFERIWRIICPPRPSLYLVDLPMSHRDPYIYPLSRLSEWLLDQSTAIDDKVDLWMEKYMQLFFSIKDAQSNPDLAIWGRNLFLRYFSRRAKEAVAKTPHDSGWINRFIYQNNYRRLVGECVIQNIRHETTPELLTCEAAFLFSLICAPIYESPALSELWKILNDSDKTSSTQNTDISFLRITLSLINIYWINWRTTEELQSMEVTLLKQYLSDDFISPSSRETLRPSLWVALYTEWLDQLAQNRPFAQLDLCNLFHSSRIRFSWGTTDLEVNEKLQIRFAEIYSNFITDMVSKDAWPDNYLARVHSSVYGFFGKFEFPFGHRQVFVWDWITVRECAKTIMEAIQKYRSRFDRGEEEIEGQSTLFARCLEVRGQLPASDSDLDSDLDSDSEDVQGEGDETAEKCIVSLHEDVSIWVRGHPSSYY